ncbi:16S rRNA (cytosine967-C5)-methyltransferase [Anaerosolibacter carboniphilus]|uniref:16S rRNA (cytosine(967)-C(5))-methyltransferase n=1 Tax=Anaerosolibacter carboniphilus TaxID=1417629 RepID=A0A841KUA6_9FIRM|nr:16S rRNA (cytosine(967)-C(5))-methyltransferase RsmB [Anaerosolibacter carboniphilus]MBB6216953.1 16S rRNA (cytosine967-C5)-methyltransferase [Anaerosolibacter carboniphilus]
MNARKIALDILTDIDRNNAYSNIALNKHLRGKALDGRDQRFITELVYGTVENKIYLDYIIGQLSKTKIDKIHPSVMSILRLGLYQIIYLDKIPPSAAVDESVKLTKKVQMKASGFVNGLLRNYLRNRENIRIPNYNENPVAFLSVTYSHPEWLVEKWMKEFGAEFTEKLLQGNNAKPTLTARVNTLKIEKERLMDYLRTNHIEVTEGKYVEEAIKFENMYGLEELEAFQKGYFQIQDESSMLVAHVLDPKPQEVVMDVCAAPGGKTTHIAQLMENRGTIIARDIHEHKLKLIDNTAKRLGITIIKTQCYNAKEIDETMIDKAHRVLVDAPCSGLGIIRRKPEIKYNKKPDDLKKITDLQLEILENASKYVIENGYLVYSTCTITNEENIGVIERFLSRNQSFVMVDVNPLLPESLRGQEKYLQLYPHIDDMDGFFICRLQKRTRP